jgi:DNA mismatch repair ATPase MutL
MICPQDMNTTAIDELTIREHLELFHANGFAFVDNPVTGRLQLSAVPFSRTTTFGMEDVHELVCSTFLSILHMNSAAPLRTQTPSPSERSD